MLQFCLAVQNSSMIISAPHTPGPVAVQQGGEFGDASAPLGARGPAGLLRSWQRLCEAAPGLPRTVTKQGEAAMINAVPLGSRRAANHVLWQRLGGSGSRSRRRVATPGQSPEQAPTPCPEGLSSVGGRLVPCPHLLGTCHGKQPSRWHPDNLTRAESLS